MTVSVAVLLAHLAIGTLTAGPSGEPPEPAVESEPAQLRVLLLPPVIEGTLSDQAKTELDARLREGLAHENLELIAATDACSDDLCIRDAARTAGASHAIATTIRSRGRDFHIDLRVLSLREATMAASIDCPVCGVSEAGTQLIAKARAMRDWVLADGMLARVRITGVPEHAQVWIDGEQVGSLPIERELDLGTHEIVVRAEGYVDKPIPLEAIAGSTIELSVALDSVAPAPVVPEQPIAERAPILVDTPRWRLPVGAVLTSVGVVGLATGATFLALDGHAVRSRCRDPINIDADGDCKYRYTSTPAGIALAVGGAALAGVGVTLLILDRRHRAHATLPGRETKLVVGFDRVLLQVEF